MVNVTSFGLNTLLVLFLLVPGYGVLQGYYSATVQLDTTSRLDKLLITIIGGILTLTLMLILHRFGVFYLALELMDIPLAAQPESTDFGYEPDRGLTADNFPKLTALSLLGVILVQSILGYSLAYLFGTIVHILSSQPQKSDKDLEQPWETAVRQSALGDRITVITKNEADKIRGKIYRIGSPSEDFDLLLSGAERIRAGGDPEPLGMTYHHYQDISQVRFPDIKPAPPSEEDNWILRQVDRIWSGIMYVTRVISIARFHILVFYHRRQYSRQKLTTAARNAILLRNYEVLRDSKENDRDQ